MANIDASTTAFYDKYLKVTKPYRLDSLQSGQIINFAYESAFYGASVVVNAGKISSVNLVNGGSGYTGAPIVIISPNPVSSPGSGALGIATFDAATGALTGVTITNQGSGYLGGNVPSIAESFSIMPASTINAKSGMTYIKDIHFGTGLRID
ncbi:MAG: hypothetical protein H7296_14065 [Bacteroidia bacterium]|nr:hypothetical protein [Bacteroidia bacterium]